jgi:hypothetical protein
LSSLTSTTGTGDPVFDDTLKTALSISLNQSPFLNILSDSTVGKTQWGVIREVAVEKTAKNGYKVATSEF